MNNIKKITLVFETCQTITFENEQIENVHIYGIEDEIIRIDANTVTMIKRCHSVDFEVEKDSIPKDKYDLFDESSIVSFVIEFKNGKTEDIYVPFEECDHDSGKNQLETVTDLLKTKHIVINQDIQE